MCKGKGDVVDNKIEKFSLFFVIVNNIIMEENGIFFWGIIYIYLIKFLLMNIMIERIY